ncbi:hypothetical protein GAU_1799 [Gemmatimonas aurantiaca T-27]|uniref:ArsR family transcriptional regulator n=1 Tax=Gemmatimonas aurantiaca (strain DSM 14586 / JCM 11422 / NBRC 100505 / T-27) TaxID=379066 RepID=C1A416_GEMAT|nr:hypothetical protein [Gemmatimonas aurantiaca]BAH38841.1 hypothetical protein GAU_1799 [Gemmatimonas aurantiaca T-27]
MAGKAWRDVLRVIPALEPLSRHDIMERSGVKPETVAAYLSLFTSYGLVTKTGTVGRHTQYVRNVEIALVLEAPSMWSLRNAHRDSGVWP